MTHNHLETTGLKPTALEVEKAEIAINLVDKTLWTKDHLGAVVQLSSGGGVSNPVPITLTGVTTSIENATGIVITDTSYDPTVSYLAEVDFGSVVDNADGTYTLTIPDYAVATSVTFTLGAAKIGYDDGLKTHVIAVTNTQVATPILSSAGTGSESTTVVVTDSADEADATYFPSVDYGSVVDNGGGSYTVTLPAFNVAPTNTVTFSLYGTRAGDIDSPTVTHQITVTEVTFVADTAVTDDLTTDIINDGF